MNDSTLDSNGSGVDRAPSAQEDYSHHREIIPAREIDVGVRDFERQVVVHAVIADLKHKVARLATAEGTVDAFVMIFNQVIQRFFINLFKPEFGREDVEHLAEHLFGRVGRVDLVGDPAEERLVDQLFWF